MFKLTHSHYLIQELTVPTNDLTELERLRASEEHRNNEFGVNKRIDFTATIWCLELVPHKICEEKTKYKWETFP